MLAVKRFRATGIPPPRSELVSLLQEPYTAGTQEQAGVIGDWLEEYGGPEDTEALALMRLLHREQIDWQTRRYHTPQPPDINPTVEHIYCIQREPFHGTTWSAIGFRVGITGFRMPAWMATGQVLVRTETGRIGMLGPIPTTTAFVLALLTQGIPVLPAEDLP